MGSLMDMECSEPPPGLDQFDYNTYLGAVLDAHCGLVTSLYGFPPSLVLASQCMCDTTLLAWNSLRRWLGTHYIARGTTLWEVA